MSLKNSTMFRSLGLVAMSMTLVFCTKNKSHKNAATGDKPTRAETRARKAFKLSCLGESPKCEKNEVAATNVSRRTYSHLIMICSDKENPEASDKDPHYIWPFSLSPNETKCMPAQDECLKKNHVNKKLGKYFTLLQLDSDDQPVWMLGADCDPKSEEKSEEKTEDKND